MLSKTFAAFLLLLLLAAGSCTTSTGRDVLWKLKDDSDSEILLLREVVDSLAKLSPQAKQQSIAKLEEQISPANPRLYSKLLYVKSGLRLPSLPQAETQMQTAMQTAESLEDDRLVAAYGALYTNLLLYKRPNYRMAAPYAIKSIELQRKIGFPFFPSPQRFLRLVAQTLYGTRNYSESIRYYHELMSGDLSSLSDSEIASAYNSFAFCYRDLHQYDSAMLLYKKGWQFALQKNLPVWTWLLRGNQAYIHLAQQRYDSAENIAASYYKASLAEKAYHLSAKAQTMIGMARIGQHDYTGAKEALLRADSLVTYCHMSPYEEHSATYQHLAQVYEKLGDTDKAYAHFKKYIIIKDSVDRSLNATAVEALKTQLAFDKAEAGLRLLRQQKHSDEVRRNYIGGILLLLVLVSLLLLNRQRLRSLHKAQLALQQKAAAEAEMEASVKELQAFTQNVVEKNKLIDSLQAQLEQEKNYQDIQTKIESLRQQVILTEEDWQNFKTLFQKVYPRFFDDLRKLSPDATAAEQRMAALLRLFTDNKQIASMLGISVDSVRKTRRRLSQRLGIEADALEVLVLNLGESSAV